MNGQMMNNQMMMNNQNQMMNQSNYQMMNQMNNQMMKGMNTQMNGNVNANARNMQAQNWQQLQAQYTKSQQQAMYYPQPQSQQQSFTPLANCNRATSDTTCTWATNSLCSSSESAQDSVSPSTPRSTSWEHSVDELVGDAVDEVLGKMG